MSGDALPRDLSFPSGTSLADTFRYTARQYADDIAVVAGSWQVRYAELDAWSDALCGQLLAAGGTSPWVAIAGVAHPGAIAAILGILKAGRGYLAIGVSGHSDQPQRILAHSGADRVLAAPGSPLARAAAALPAVRALDPVAPPAADAANLNGLAPAGDAAAYLAYTSGSTGTPKGVIQSHAAVLASVAAMRGMDLFRPGERVALLTPLTFGAASQELFGTLLSGGTLCVYDADDPDSGTVSEWLARVRPDTVVSVPSRARTWVPQPDLGLRNLLVGAERLYGRDL
ncbi:MAG: AMP-binding protein, partial [Gammaproteobacteria bacterium]|nr:AMP-binding protein [Gammaproteobacteria bacterium]